MKKKGFEQRLQEALGEARELSGLWTNTTIADIIDSDVKSLLEGVENGEAEEVTDELFPKLLETLNYANIEYQNAEG